MIKFLYWKKRIGSWAYYNSWQLKGYESYNS